ASMPELARAFQAAGFGEVRTVLSSGNVVFSARPRPRASLERACEEAMAAGLGKAFPTIVRPVAALRALLDADPCAELRLPAGAKRVVTFIGGGRSGAPPDLPIERDG